jgi:DNA-damage-inducible protein J
MSHTSTVKARIEDDLKAQSESVLKQIGMDMSGAIKVFLTQVVQHRGLPFEVKIAQPNAVTLKAIEDSHSGKVESFDSVAAMLADATR